MNEQPNNRTDVVGRVPSRGVPDPNEPPPRLLRRLHRVWPDRNGNISYLLTLCADGDREALRRFDKGSLHKTIYFPEWLSAHIAIPPLAEQTRIVAEVERRLSVVEELESVVTANLQRAVRLRQSILQKAFTGQLV
jgi:hypothetical protein